MEINDADWVVICNNLGSDRNFHSYLWGHLTRFPQWKEVQMERKTLFQKILTRLPAFGFSSIPADLITLI